MAVRLCLSAARAQKLLKVSAAHGLPGATEPTLPLLLGCDEMKDMVVDLPRPASEEQWVRSLASILLDEDKPE
eukprot:2807960-Amphidinium_carterae.1